MRQSRKEEEEEEMAAEYTNLFHSKDPTKFTKIGIWG
jgi:hypothetical protein